MPTSAALRVQIEALLAESFEAAAARERQSFPALLHPTDGSVVLFGAGRVGQLCARALRRGGLTLRAFCDSNPNLHGSQVAGVDVITPQEAAHRFGASALFVVTIWTGTARESMVERMDSLRRLGCQFVTSYAALVWAFGRDETPFHSFELPSRILGSAPALRSLADLLEDQDSLMTLNAVLRQRLHGQFDDGRPATDQYFPLDILTLRTDEVFVDGGAYTGDTLDDFLARTGSRFLEYHAFEPDSANVAQLRLHIASLSTSARQKIFVHAAALYLRNESLQFSEEGRPTSKILLGGDKRVSGKMLDDVIADRLITFLKLDVEGAERDALVGAKSVISRSKPVAAICVYHGPSDLWVVPTVLREYLPQHRFFLRQHQFDGYELVVYAVPPERCIAHRQGR
jgi:FkbM family methyltransferase